MIYKTKLGEIDIRDEDILYFNEGIPGFTHLRKFALIPIQNQPIQWLTSIEDPFVALPVVDPWLVCIDYSLTLTDEDIQDLDIKDKNDVGILSILTIPKGCPEKTTINLLAPIVINLKNRKAKQIIQENSSYSVKHLVKDEIERSQSLLKKSKTGSE
ncbi:MULTISPECIES: flagellar assembly protein FliW [Pseudothermotoga]|jgi:flagellar assembly factor FliW|uniref:Flagellar assembly factor FliW n=2 Tax=Pseudothermotoga TaxID=1643951 RepID=FLIW_PSELT|nr:MULTISPECIES: flagellar assembly protein FliW [Pseudothermotoga]A8F502.1 RecName: Full=Flagellar assembly factor FliW [Pseudothermotoga lettingae TMO]ABV33236.1 protein of unknown function DUF180 [Pseudothermotoga lettingae TMO]KUK22030.1 MAG: Flagellar assembly factor FliW [Pseudothermotoga lettingae]MDI3493882.1 flagellar assembly factor FliW [Pseudothermotoga sp.]MDK2885329.1 flagellar assembly factor FliW [Pseudothermotoga sp.]GLI49847.1 flagellar assembly factor FliW [Pseudothermotoga